MWAKVGERGRVGKVRDATWRLRDARELRFVGFSDNLNLNIDRRS